MTETKGTYNAGGPTAEDRRQAARLQEIRRELDAMQAALPNDAAHNVAFEALGQVLASLGRAEEALLLEE